MSISSRWTAALFATALLMAGNAQAVPTLYQFVDGSAVVRLTIGTATLAESAPLVLGGVFATFDGDGPGTLTDFEFSIVPEQTVALDTPLAGYNLILLHYATLKPAPIGYTNIIQQNNGGGNYFIAAGPVLTSTYLDVLSTLGPPPVYPAPFVGNSATPLVATINLTAGNEFTLDGIEIGTFTNSDFPTIPVGVVVSVKMDLSFHGRVPVPTPEPATVVLMGIAIVGLVGLRSRRV